MAIVDLKLPKYKIELPVSKRTIEYRPFTVKEEKILLLAQEENTIDAILQSISQIVSNCTFGKETLDSMNKFDAEYLFIQIRNKSMGEGVNIRAICKECKEKTPMTLDFSNMKVLNINKQEPIKIIDDVWVVLRYPTLKESLKFLDDKDGMISLAYILETIIDGEEVKIANNYTMEERIELIESLTNTQIKLLKDVVDNFPVFRMDIDYTCKCGVKNHIEIEGIEDFFV